MISRAWHPNWTPLSQLKREEANIKADILGVTPYEALLDQFDPGRREAQVDRIFDDLAEFLPGTLQEVLDKQASAPPPLLPKGPFSPEKQRELGLAVMKIPPTSRSSAAVWISPIIPSAAALPGMCVSPRATVKRISPTA